MAATSTSAFTCSSNLYYDIDAILAEEELVPINNLLDFTHLAHLDPDYVHPNQNSSSCGAKVSPSSDNERQFRNQMQKEKKSQHCLLENTRFKMPLWSIQKWAELNFVRLSLPKHYNRRGRERLDADPVSVDLRKKSERFYMSGMALVDLIHACVQGFHQNNANTSSNNTQATRMNRLHNESQELKRTLLMTYTGARLRRTFDWTLSNIEDDVSSYTEKLTEMEQMLFRCGASASHAFVMWKLHGSRRICVSETALRAGTMSCSAGKENGNSNTATPTGIRSKRSLSSTSKLVSPDNDANVPRKRMRSY
jgi:hypothetical protein